MNSSEQNRLPFALRLTALLIAFFSGFAAPFAAAGTGAMKTATLMPLWTPQAQFAGYYVAQEKGIYARHGIQLQLLKAGPGYSPTAALERGEADFAVLWLTTALQHRAAGMAVTNLSQTIQHSSLMLVARKNSGIRSIEDMQDKKIGLWGGDLSLPVYALFSLRDIRFREIRQSQTVNLFLRGGVDVASAMWYNEYHTMLNSGLNEDELTLFFLDQEGMRFPEDGIYAMQQTLERDPALAAAFVKASMEGWQYAFDHPEEALDIVIRRMREARLPANRVHQRWMLKRMQDLMQPQNHKNSAGRLDKADFDKVQSTMKRMGQILHPVRHEDFTWVPDGH
jgi:NitT/TauT family transport system substrate-binding protein